MPRRSFVPILMILASAFAFAQEKPLTNSDVVAMVKAGLPESTIILNIERSQSKFDTSAQALIELNKSGISAKILDAMIAAKQTGYSESQPASATSETRISASPPADPLLAQMEEPGIYIVDNGKVSLIEPTVFSGSKTNTFWGAVTYGIAKTKIRAKVQRKAANARAESAQPVLYFVFNPAYRDSGATMAGGWWGLPATSPNEFVLVKMEIKSASREAVIGEYGTFSGVSSGTRDKDTREYSFEKIRPGVYKVTITAPLAPGEYCFYYAGNVAGIGVAGGKIFDFGVTAAR